MSGTTKKHWRVTVFHNLGNEEQFTLPESTSKDDLKTLIRLVVASHFSASPIVDAFKSGDYRQSALFTVQEDKHGTVLKSSSSSPSVYAALEDMA